MLLRSLLPLLLLAAVRPADTARVTRRAVVSLPAAGGLAALGSRPAPVAADDTALAVPAEQSAPPAAALAPEPAPEPVAPPAPPAPPLISAFDFDVPFRGEPREIKPFLGKANVVVNVKFDDPITLDQLPGLMDLLKRFKGDGLHVLAFPTDQGWFEAEDSNTLRLMFKNVYDFGQFPTAVVFDKADLLGTNALPLYTWLQANFPNPWGVNRIVFNYEKFLVDDKGQPLRRYPRKYPISLIEADVQALLEGRPLPAPSERYVQAWEAAKREAIKSEYAFKPGLNYYKTGSPAS